MFEYIDTTHKLRLFVDKISNAPWLALDTEFLREKTYFAKLCLIQIEAGEHRACIDPLLIDDLSPFYVLLENPDIVKVFHAAHQDIEILLQESGKMPAPIFDTQIAASVLGYGDQMGYARLVEQVLGVTLSKTQSRTDWTRRPLNKKQLEYAIDDVRYLAQIYPKMLQLLTEKNRLAWLQKDFSRAVDPDTYAINARQRWKKVRGNQVLNAQQLAVLRELAAWREERAEKSNIPRRWVLSDDILLDLARQQPETSEAIGEIRGLSDKAKKYHQEWLALINKAQNMSESEWPVPPRSQKPTARQNLIIDLLMLVIQLQAKKNGLTAASIATRKQVAKMVQANKSRLSDDWRGELVNTEFARILSGEMVLGIENDKVTLINHLEKNKDEIPLIKYQRLTRI